MPDVKLIDIIRHMPEPQLETVPRYIALEHADLWLLHERRNRAMMRPSDLPVIVADNVQEYIEQTNQDEWVPERDFPCLAPPYPIFWIEHYWAPWGNAKRGALFVSGDASDSRIRKWMGDELHPDAHWVYTISPYAYFGKDAEQPPHSFCMFTLQVGKKGLPLGKLKAQSLSQRTGKTGEWAEREAFELIVVLFAVYLMHCKKLVQLVDGPPLPPKLAKRTEQRLGYKPTKYKTLVIEPFKAMLRKEGKSDEVGVQRALHHCRGHIVTYTEERPMFGKITGTFWVPFHFRGTRRPDQTEPIPPREIEIKL
jgi:hypothetical protein